ncbi:class I SAM-dependent methyltransferase [Methylosinus trichosporium OB3b]|uniref:Class I SAM-dependent methyltransferase n=1 Tax=Methylosinus trichosporium (strain ATCC 35070 / NCIMB 11131 / UNIQEM 75 / OB3b) TaxID=595536 RepID=A0A2D2CY39_METT3|nr:class I SAM-dependent methyltransferase [Methylosinus trichosporium OB3b]OBS53666.1 hypothetical protein A8B73_04915 [Methylosinus sp. 3S-1]
MTALRYSYEGICNLCGHKGRFEGDDLRQARDHFACPSCNASLRFRNQAAAILSHFADGTEFFLDRFTRNELFTQLAIVEQGAHGPFARRFKKLPNYQQAYLFEDLPIGESQQPVASADVERRALEKESVDLVLTSDLLKHLPDPRKAIADIARVLKPGGAHIFTIPIPWPIPPASTARAKLIDGRIEHLAEPKYHRTAQGEPLLTFTEFGADILDWHAKAGMRAYFYDSHRMIGSLGRYPAVVATKL